MRAAAVIFGLIVLNGLFASAELALVSARRSRLKALAEQGHRDTLVLTFRSKGFQGPAAPGRCTDSTRGL